VATALRAGRRRYLVDGFILERRQLGGLGQRLLVQRAAAELIVLCQVIGVFRCLGALEGRQGDLQRAGNLRGRGHGKADAHDQCKVKQGGDHEGKAQPIGRAHTQARRTGGDRGVCSSGAK
jgi:hypothetical protein